MSSIKKQSGKSANQAKIFNFLFRKLQKIRINFDEKFKITTKELVYENDTDPSNLVTISKKSMSKILKFNNKKITDLQNYLFFLFDFYETNNFENISKFNVNFKLLVCLVKFFYIGIKNDENKIKFNKEAMLKIFKMSEITQYNVLDYLDIYQTKIDEYSGKKIFLLAGKNVLKKKYSHFFIKKFNFLFGIAFKPKKLKTNKISKSDEILNNLGMKLKKIYEDEYQKTNSEIIKKFIGNINVFNDLNDENENENSKSKIYRNVLKSNVNKNKISNDFNQKNIPFSFKIENSEKSVNEKENYVPESADDSKEKSSDSMSKEERLKSRLKKIRKPNKKNEDINGEKIQKEIESIVIENKDNQGDDNNNKEEEEKRLKEEEEKRLKEEEEKRIKDEEEKRLKEEEEKRLKEEEEKRLKEEEEKRLKEEEEKRIKEEEEKRLKEEEEKRLKEEEEKRLKEEEEKRLKEEEEKRIKEEEEKRIKEEQNKINEKINETETKKTPQNENPTSNIETNQNNPFISTKSNTSPLFKSSNPTQTTSNKDYIIFPFLLCTPPNLSSYEFYVCGSIPQIGSWKINNSLKLNFTPINSRPYFTNQIKIKKSEIPFEYKYFYKIKNQNQFIWYGKPFENYQINEIILPLIINPKQKNKNFSIFDLNIRYYNLNDGENIWENRKKNLINLLINYQPDIFFFQEITHIQFNYLQNKLEFLYEFLGKFRDDSNESEMCSIVYNKKIFSLNQSGTFWLSSTPNVPYSNDFENFFPRICTWANLQKDFKQFLFFNLHLDHINLNAHKKCINVVLNQIKNISNNEIKFILIGGCFYCDENDEIIEMIKNDGFKEIMFENSFHGFTGIGNKHWDYLFYKENEDFKEKNVKILKDESVIDKNKNIFISDHFPIFVEFNED